MKSLILVVLCFYSVSADVSELLYKPDPHGVPHFEHISTLEHVFEGGIEVEPVPEAVPFGLSNEGIEVVQALEVIPLAEAVPAIRTHPHQQHGHAHPDYQGPYHYVKPKVQLEYGTPLEDGPVEHPKVQDEQPTSEYLPPAGNSEVPVKRQVKLLYRRRV
ncbi:uncharacterized protein LOC6034708 [Culex quinquefasciatus]|uniref:uncharacterized protein LOC6034708 n=1 Tax=Culex quinquefasciatus TaxID=7176 RepID=UPI0018E2E17A|nr:uncharacterized protein LOC6034708 [Culex quinquefasciatus]